MDFFDNALNKAKEAFEVVSQKTEEVVSTQKNKFDIASIKGKRSKDFERLGELYFNLIKEDEIDSQEIKDLVDSIKEKNDRIKSIEEELKSNKKLCPNCSAVISEYDVFCSSCGSKLV